MEPLIVCCFEIEAVRWDDIDTNRISDPEVGTVPVIMRVVLWDSDTVGAMVYDPSSVNVALPLVVTRFDAVMGRGSVDVGDGGGELAVAESDDELSNETVTVSETDCSFVNKLVKVIGELVSSAVLLQLELVEDVLWDTSDALNDRSTDKVRGVSRTVAVTLDVSVSVEVCGSDLLFDCITVALVVNVAEPLTDVE